MAKIRNLSIFGQIALFIGIMLLTTTLMIAVWYFIFGNSQSLWSLKIMQMLQTIGTFMLPCFIFAYLISDQPAQYLHLNKSPQIVSYLLAISLIIAAQPGINLLSWINEQLSLPEFLQPLEQLMKSQEEAAAQLTERFIKADNWYILLFNIFFIALLPAFSEELCFRGVIQNIISKYHHVAIWVSAFIFSAIHFQFYGFLPRLLLGATFGYMLYWSDSIWLSAAAHFTNNAAAVILYNILSDKQKTADFIDSFGREDTWWVGIISLTVSAIFIYFLRRYTLKRKCIISPS